MRRVLVPVRLGISSSAILSGKLSSEIVERAYGLSSHLKQVATTYNEVRVPREYENPILLSYPILHMDVFNAVRNVPLVVG